MIEKTENNILPSVLDRLLNDSIEKVEYEIKPQKQVLREIHQSIRRDLENLLNTQKRCLSWPSDWKELNTSLVDYGLPDYITDVHGSVTSQEEFCRIIERTICRYEPRFKDVSVKLIKNVEAWDHCMRFQIKALLCIESTKEVIVYNSRLDAEKERFFIDT